MLFKGTRARSCAETGVFIDDLGGHVNAVTGRESTCVYAHVASDDMHRAFDFLFELCFAPTFDSEAVELEKQVVVEEIHGVEDAPEELVVDLFTAALWPRNRLGKPVLGREDQVRGFTATALRRFHKRFYRPENMHVVAAGMVSHSSLCRWVEAAATRWFVADRRSVNPAPWPPPPRASARSTVQTRDIAQVHLCLGLPSYGQTDARKYSAAIIDIALGGGCSSRLFRSIREQRGLAYSVGSFSACYLPAGYLAVSASVAPRHLDCTCELIGRELADLRNSGIGRAELERARRQLKASLVIGQESLGARMTALGRSELYFGRPISTREILASLDAVSADDVAAVAADLIRGRRLNMAVVGPVDESQSLDIDVGGA